MPSIVIEKSLSLYYSMQGEGPPLFFIHLPVLGHQVFIHQKHLVEHYQVIFFDLPGHGRSSMLNKKLSISNLADDLYKLLDAIDVGTVAICGFLYGTLVAQEFALKYPERVNSLILCSGFLEVKTCNIKTLAAGGIALAKLNQLPLLARIMAKTHRYYTKDEEELYQYALKASRKRFMNTSKRDSIIALFRIFIG